MSRKARTRIIIVLTLLWIANTYTRLHISDFHPAGGYFVWGLQVLVALGAALFVGALIERNRFSARVAKREREEDARHGG